MLRRHSCSYGFFTKALALYGRSGAKNGNSARFVPAAREVTRDSVDNWAEGPEMQDVWMLVFTVLFFALAFGYIRGCHRLR